MKILFQEPFVSRAVTYGKFARAAGNNTFSYGMACVAAYVAERGHEVHYLDPMIEGMTEQDYLAFLRRHRFDVIGMGSTTVQIDYTMRTMALVKKHFPDIITVLGGVHATLMPEETLRMTDAVDYLVLGEGEKPFSRLLDCLSRRDAAAARRLAGVAYADPRGPVVNPFDERDRLEPDELPIPLYDAFPMRSYEARISYAKTFPTYTLLASRGCPFQCGFCNASATMGRKIRTKPTDVILDEIRLLKERFGARGLIFLDSTFTAKKAWVLDFCEAYRSSDLGLPWACNARVDTVDEETLRAMKDAGCWTMLFGVESGNQKSLDLLRKGTTVEQNESVIRLALRLGFYVYTSYILCLPGEDEEDAKNTIRFANRMGNHLAVFYLPVPFPKTELERLAKEDGGLRETRRYEDYNSWDFSRPVYVNPLIGKEKMQRLLKHAFLSFYSNPKVWYRNAKEAVLMRQSLRKWWRGLMMLGDAFRL